MSHAHRHAGLDLNWAFGLGVALNVLYVIAEAAAGFLLNSVALLADATHNLSDVLSLLLAWGAHYLSHLPPTRRYTYGFRSSTILAALFNALLLLVAVGAIGWESVRRFGEPAAVPGGAVMAVAGVGVVINALTALLFLRDRHTDLNVRGAFLHMAADAAVSVGVVLAGWGVLATGRAWIDPAAGLVIALVILVATWGLLRESVNLALHAVPEGIDPGAVAEYLLGRPGVTAVHDLHIWGMSTTEVALTAHLVRPDGADDDAFLRETSRELRDRFGIGHATLQVERGCEGEPCGQGAPGRV
ncbi:MAG TPA: cation diffusion facilitator family transporter [Gemmataceae bacterium]